MRRIQIVGLCLGAVFAFSAMAASSAYAGEYGTCVKTKEVEKHYTGNYKDKNCTEYTGSGTSEYEWEPTLSGSKIAVTDSSKVATLESALGNVTCKKSTSAGDITGPKSATDTVTFTSCEAVKEKANSEGEPAGTIKTSLLNARLVDHGETAGGKEPAVGEVWDCLTSAEGPYLAQFEFSKIKLRVKGEVCGVVTGINQMATKSTQTFSKGGGFQGLQVEYSLNEGASWEGPIAGTQVTTATTKNPKMEIKS